MTRPVACAELESAAGGAAAEVPGTASPVFEAVYAENAEFVWRSLARLGVPESTLPDALQEVFLVAYTKLGEFEGRSSVRTWLFGIAMRVASRAARQRRRRPVEPLPDTLPADPRDIPFEAAARSEAVVVLYRLLDELSPDQRAVFVLVELEQMSVPEAAEAVQANLNTVTSRLKTARKKFEAGLRRHRAKSDWRRP
ncbi:MAG TPA: sigma-70 family RNA polymerase sigma factor [Polyangiaceae bacterium]